MGRQIRFFLLPADVDWLLDEFRATATLRVVAAKTESSSVVEVTSSTAERTTPGWAGFSSYDRVYLLPAKGQTPTMSFVGYQDGYWLVDTECDVIEFDGCDFRNDLLRQGRMYFETDMLNATKDAMVPKDSEFVAWAETVFRRARKLLRWSRELDAYIGPSAHKWHLAGGQFIDDSSPIWRLLMAQPKNGLLQ